MDRSVEEAVAGGAWLFLSNLAVSLAGLLFWLVIARLAGVESVGAAGAVVGAAGAAATLASSGITIAITREVAVHGLPAASAGLALALLLGIPAALASALLVKALGYAGLAIYAAALASFMVAAQALSFVLVGMEMFREYFHASLAASVAKLALGAGLAVLGYRLAAPLAGFLAFPLALAGVSLAVILPRLVGGRAAPSWGRLRGLAALTASNYPFMLSSQLLMVLSVYAYALISGEEASTGSSTSP